MATDNTMTISRAADAAGVGVETIRFYEREGLIERPREHNASGYRVYPDPTIRRIRTIRRAQTLGFSLREARELLALGERKTEACAKVRARASVKLDEVRNKIERLRRIERALERLIAACPSGEASLTDCPILQALDDDTPWTRADNPVTATSAKLSKTDERSRLP